MDIISDVVNKVYFTKTHYKEMLYGAYIIINDDGKFYRKWSKKNHTKPRISSHYSKNEEHEAKLKPRMTCSAVVLFGTTKNGNTWFQIEKTTKDCFMKHTIDYFDHLLSGRNIGVYGNSKYTENKPLKLKLL